MKKLLAGGLLTLGLVLVLGCGDSDEPTVVEEVFSAECADICERWDECRGPIDVDDCIDQCEAEDDDDALGGQISDCEDCLDDRSCSEAEACWPGCPVFAAMG